MSVLALRPGHGLASGRGAMRLDDEQVRRRTRATMVVSVILHVLLFLWILTVKSEPAGTPPLTEIMLIDPGPAAGPPTAAAAAPADETVKGLPAAGPTDAHFQRLNRNADLRPEPQSRAIAADQLAARLATMRQNPSAEPIAMPTGGASSAMISAPATITGRGGSGSAPLALARGGSGSGPALELARGDGGHGALPATVTTGMPGEGAAASAPAGTREASAKRSLAGATLMGPIADRPILHLVTPVYPDWAKHDAVEGSVTLYFVVRPDGSVKENVLVQKTAGFEDFDESARSALRAWRFEPLHGGRTGEQWGTITFHFKLQNRG